MGTDIGGLWVLPRESEKTRKVASAFFSGRAAARKLAVRDKCLGMLEGAGDAFHTAKSGGVLSISSEMCFPWLL